jgi:hypothetical protein
MALHQLLVEMLDGEALVFLLIKLLHPPQLVRRRPLRRRPVYPSIDQPVRAILLVALAPAAQRPLAHPQRRRRFAMTKAAALKPLQQLLETHDPDPRQPLHPAPRSKSFGTVPEPDRSRAT